MNDLQKALDELLSLSGPGTTWGNIERAKLKRLREAIGPATAVSEMLNVSLATIYSWEKQEQPDVPRPAPPQRQLRRFSTLIADKHFSSLLDRPKSETPQPVLYDVLMKMRSLKETMERCALGTRFWVLRSGRPFVAGNDPAAFEFMARFLRENSADSYFVYLDADQDIGIGARHSRAKESFESLMERVTAAPDSTALLKKIHEVPIKDPVDAYKLGFTDTSVSYAMAEYGAEGRRKFQRDYDVWLEFVFDISKDPQNEQKQFMWLELPADE